MAKRGRKPSLKKLLSLKFDHDFGDPQRVDPPARSGRSPAPQYTDPGKARELLELTDFSDPAAAGRAGQLDDRMLRYRNHPPCPRCAAAPSVCTMKRGSYRASRCRLCGTRWEWEAR